MPGDTRCISHSENPEVQELKRQAVSKGGKALKKAPVNLPEIQINDVKGVARVLAESINLLRSDNLPPPKARALVQRSESVLEIAHAVMPSCPYLLFLSTNPANAPVGRPTSIASRPFTIT